EEIVRESVQTAAPMAPLQEAVQVREAAPAAVVAAEAPAVVAEAPVLAAPPVAERPITARPQPAPAPAAPAPVAAPLKIEWPSDLQQVETKAERVQAALAAADDGAPKRVKRVRPPAEPVANEPLQQVETRN
ncbi:MAG: ribonuclease E/G, partial [Burkholderiales bacterium]